MKKPLFFVLLLLFNLVVAQFASGVSGSDQSIKSSAATGTDAATVAPVFINLPQTGAKTSFGSGDDGYLKRGAAWPNPRFTAEGDCVTDNLTGLMWVRKRQSF